MIPFDDPTTLSLLFHLNSEPWLNDEAYRSNSQDASEGPALSILAEVALPEPRPTSLDQLIGERRSWRAYDPSPMTLADVASLLRAAYGTVPGPPPSPRRRAARPPRRPE